jgi:ABC-2 type transport system ATP-binding protein
MPIIATERLTKRYEATVALDGLDLELREGGMVGFIGPNGSGKTTTMRLLLGLLRPTAGTATIFGRDCWSESARIAEDLGYLPGDLRLYGTMNGRQLLRIFGLIRRKDLAGPGRRLAEAFDLDLELRVSAMSRGTRQKLGVVLAVAHEPRLLILDEPTNGLDPVMQDVLKDHLRGMARRGHTIFFSSHSLSDVEKLCDRVIIMRRGRVAIDTTLDDLRARARREVRIWWRRGQEAIPEEPPPGLEVVERSAGRWLCRLGGPVEPLLAWLVTGAKAPIDDVTIAPPDLENLFQEYYRE